MTPRGVLLVLGALSLLPTACSRSASRAAEPIIAQGPRAWALATTALLTIRNQGRLDMLSPSPPSASSVRETRGLLHDWWGIDSRADLLRTLEYLDHEGHRGQFQKMALSLLSMTEAEYQARLTATADHPEIAARMKLAREHYQKHRRNSFAAWDYCRYVMLCRWGYTVGFLTSDQAWQRIMPAARTIQTGFRSWSEMGEDYLVGRQFWSSEESERTGQIYRDIEARLLEDPGSVWNRLPWDTRLGTGMSP